MIQELLTYLIRLFSGRCTECGANDWLEYGYYGNYRCRQCGNKQ